MQNTKKYYYEGFWCAGNQTIEYVLHKNIQQKVDLCQMPTKLNTIYIRYQIQNHLAIDFNEVRIF